MASEIAAEGPAQSAGSGLTRGIMGPTLASWLILLASFVNFLRYNNYPLLRAEVALIVLGMLVLAAAVGFVHRRERSTRGFHSLVIPTSGAFRCTSGQRCITLMSICKRWRPVSTWSTPPPTISRLRTH